MFDLLIYASRRTIIYSAVIISLLAIAITALSVYYEFSEPQQISSNIVIISMYYLLILSPRISYFLSSNNMEQIVLTKDISRTRLVLDSYLNFLIIALFYGVFYLIVTAVYTSIYSAFDLQLITDNFLIVFISTFMLLAINSVFANFKLKKFVQIILNFTYVFIFDSIFLSLANYLEQVKDISFLKKFYDISLLSYINQKEPELSLSRIVYFLIFICIVLLIQIYKYNKNEY